MAMCCGCINKKCDGRKFSLWPRRLDVLMYLKNEASNGRIWLITVTGPPHLMSITLRDRILCLYSTSLLLCLALTSPMNRRLSSRLFVVKLSIASKMKTVLFDECDGLDVQHVCKRFV